MRVLVAYATRHGATRGIAQRIGERLTAAGLDVTVAAAASVDDVRGYDAFVIGGATYLGRWLKPLDAFVRRHRAALAEAPVWLFSSGPLGTQTVDAKGRDVRQVAAPGEFAELTPVIHPRGTVVFFGAFDPDATPASIAERVARPFWSWDAIRQAMPAGDFRDWPAIDAYADSIARQLTHPAVTRPTIGHLRGQPAGDRQPSNHGPAGRR